MVKASRPNQLDCQGIPLVYLVLKLTEIESYNVSNFSTYIYDNTFTFIDKDITSYYLTDSNVKIYPEATFVSPYIGVLLGQNVNLHGSGSISYSPVSSSLDDDSSNMED